MGDSLIYLLFFALSVIVGCGLTCVIRYLGCEKPAEGAAAEPPSYDFDDAAAAEHLRAAVRIPTVSYGDKAKVDFEQFRRYHDFLREAYPAVFARAEWTDRGASLMGFIPGADPTLRPCAFLAHQDVVPVEEATLAQWAHPPFSGEVADGYLYGRGALDMKGQMIALLEALDYRIARGFAPQRGIYLMFSHCEETVCGPDEGAYGMCEQLRQQGVELSFVFDEGGGITPGEVFRVDKLVGQVAVLEKGYTDIILSAEAPGGHASMPPRHTALGLVAAAITAIENHPLPAKAAPLVKAAIDALAPHMKGAAKFCCANRWLLWPVIRRAMLRDPRTAALLRTTFAATKAQGGPAHNVLPKYAEALVNTRLAPQDDLQSVGRHVRRLVPKGVNVELTLGSDPTGAASTDSYEYRLLGEVLRDVFPEVIAVPSMMVGGTDARKFEPVCGCILRFSPFLSQAEDAGTIHNVNERLALDSFRRATVFFIHYLGKL